MTAHEKLDLDRWLNEFTLERMIEEKQAAGREYNYVVPEDWLPGGAVVSSPLHLAKIEHTRRELIRRGHDLGTAYPVDVFLWRICKRSEGPVTRIGGVPFRDPKKPWPNANRGYKGLLKAKRPLPFLAQISFLDSKDHVPSDLPGDVLCIYGDWSGQYAVDEDSLLFEWVSEKNGQDADFMDIPEVPSWSYCAEGVIHRTTSYPDCYGLLLDLDIPMPYTVNLFQATMIGQHAHFIQEEPDHLHTLIATFSSLQPRSEWPFINCPEVPRFTYPKGHEGRLDSLFSLMMGDMGAIFFYKDNDGKFQADGSCY